MNRIRYNDEFKRETVKQISEGGYSVTDVTPIRTSQQTMVHQKAGKL